MKIERIFIACFRNDVRWTQCCVASIRSCYPDIGITLLKDRFRGDFDTSELEAIWDVDVFDTGERVFGWGMIKLEPLMTKGGQRIMVMDSDVLFLGPALDALDAYDEDFIVDNHEQRVENIDKYYFDRAQMRAYDPEFILPEWVFNGGVVVATTGKLTRRDFEPLIDYDAGPGEPPQIRNERVFRPGEQGILNYVVFKHSQEGRLTVRGLGLQHWAGYVPPRSLPISRLRDGSLSQQILHYAGPKSTFFSAIRNGHLLRHFEAAYYARLPNGRQRRRRDRIGRMLDVLRGRQPWRRRL